MKVRANIHVLGMTPGQVREVDGRSRRIRSLIAAGWVEPAEAESEVTARVEATVPSVAAGIAADLAAQGEPPPGSGSGD